MLKLWNKLSIKWKIFVFLLFFCFMLISLLWVFQVLFLSNFYKYIKTREIKESASIISSNIGNEKLFEVMVGMSDNSDICMEIATKSGYSVYSIDSIKNCIIHKMPRSEKERLFKMAQENGGQYTEIYKNTIIIDSIPSGALRPQVALSISRVPEESLVCANVITTEDGETALLLMNSLISPVTATVQTLRIQLNYITGYTVLFSIILAFFISKRVSKPIEKINKTAKQLATGDYGVTFDETGYREINELAATLNYTAKELSKVENLRRELLANVSHDLRTPLTLISGYAEAMRDLPAENNAESIQIIIDEAKRLSTLVTNVLDISKLQSGMETLNLIHYNFTESIRKTIFRISELVKLDGYTINFIYDEDVYIDADEIKISQALYNLLINAVNYTGDDKNVIVRQTVSEAHIRLEVTDSGNGIAEEDLPYIWDRYYKVDKTHKRSVTGSGLGLSIVKQIVKLHDGDCGVVSGTGLGSTFWIELKL